MAVLKDCHQRLPKVLCGGVFVVVSCVVFFVVVWWCSCGGVFVVVFFAVVFLWWCSESSAEVMAVLKDRGTLSSKPFFASVACLHSNTCQSEATVLRQWEMPCGTAAEGVRIRFDPCWKNYVQLTSCTWRPFARPLRHQ